MADYRIDHEKGLKHSLANNARMQHIVRRIDVDRHNQSAKKQPVKKLIYLVASVFIFGLISVGITFNSLSTDKPSRSIVETVPEFKTPSEIPFVDMKDLKPGVILHDHNEDNMDRGGHDFFGWRVAADPDYQANANSRGDIVLYKKPRLNPLRASSIYLRERSISRIVGLPGENIKIEKGQIFIDGKQLDALYGRVHWLGKDLDGLKMVLERDDLEDNWRTYIERTILQFEIYSMDEIKIAENQFFIMGDDWVGSYDSRLFGPIPSENIVGKVFGYVHRPKNEDGQIYDALYEVISTTPELIKARGVDGTEGYVREKDLEGEMPRTPEEALAQQKSRPPGGRNIPLYDADGKTVIGVFHVGP